MGTRAMPDGPARRLRRWLVRGRGSKRFFLGLSSSPSFLSLPLLPAGGPPSIPGGTFPMVRLVYCCCEGAVDDGTGGEGH